MNININILLLLVSVPALLGLLNLFFSIQIKNFRETVNIILAGVITYCVVWCWGKNINLNIPWLHIPGTTASIDFQFRLYAFSQFILIAVAGFTLLIALYSAKFMTGRPTNNQYYAYLFLSEAMAFGATLANNLVVMLFFWEALLITTYLLISLGREKSYKTAVKALVIVGLSDLCLLLGIGIVGAQAHTLEMTNIHLITTGINGVAFVLMMIGAMGKAGAMPFHTWIPDAAIDAPLPFMAFLPAALEKLLGIYLVARIALDLFAMDTGMKILVMSVGALTIVLAVMMALIQNNYKRLLSYHAISQVGYMILGIGTGIPIGIAGGLFHMINHAMYKCCLFLTSGSVEKQTGTADLNKLGGLWKQMPLTCIAFVVAAASISGVPPFNGFVSKEMIFEGTLQTGMPIFLIAAAVGAVFTAASFLKLGHAVFFGKPATESKPLGEAHWTMILPMLILAIGCILFGLVGYHFPLEYLIKPSLAASLQQGVHAVEYKFDILSPLFGVSLLILVTAIFNHVYGVKATGRGLGASEHIHHLPGLATIYNLAEKRIFDPYDQGKRVGYYAAKSCYYIDRGIDWCYQSLIPGVAHFVASSRKIHNGLYANYLSWSLAGLAFIMIYLFCFVK